MIDQNRLKRQLEGVSKLEAEKFIGVFEWATGVGKTFASILAAKRIKELNSNDFLSINVVVPTEQLQIQWTKVLEQEKVYGQVYVINTYIKSNHECNLLILDEIHRYTNEEAIYFSTAIEKTKYKYLIGLSPIIEKKQKEFLSSFNIKIVDTITLSEAKRNNWVSEFEEYNLKLELNNEERIRYNGYSNIIKAHFPYFDNDLSTAIRCMRDKVFRKEIAIQGGYDEKELGMKATRLNESIQKRKAIMYEGKAKVEIIKDIVKGTYKTIIFSESTTYADLVEQTITNAVAYHSNLETKEIDGKKYGKKKLKDRAIDLIERGLVNCIVTAKALDEGFDVKSIDFGIIASRTSKERQQIQRRGRCIRFMENKKAIIINLYFHDTVDEGWLEKCQRSSVGVKWISNVNEINYE